MYVCPRKRLVPCQRHVSEEEPKATRGESQCPPHLDECGGTDLVLLFSSSPLLLLLLSIIIIILIVTIIIIILTITTSYAVFSAIFGTQAVVQVTSIVLSCFPVFLYLFTVFYALVDTLCCVLRS